MLRWIEVIGGPFDGRVMQVPENLRLLSLVAPSGLYVAVHQIIDHHAAFIHPQLPAEAA